MSTKIGFALHETIALTVGTAVLDTVIISSFFLQLSGLIKVFLK